MTTPADAPYEALAWLAGRLQFERLLEDLHDHATGTQVEVVDLETTPVVVPEVERAA